MSTTATSNTAIEEFRARVEALTAKGVDHMKAKMKVARDDPALHARMLRESNQGKSPNVLAVIDRMEAGQRPAAEPKFRGVGEVTNSLGADPVHRWKAAVGRHILAGLTRAQAIRRVADDEPALDAFAGLMGLR